MAMPPLAIDSKSARENLATAKAKVRNDPELLAELEKQEEWLTKIEQIRATLQEAANAESTQKQALLERRASCRKRSGKA
jgi:antitoxin component of MazEF toxin-antitoxin module